MDIKELLDVDAVLTKLEQQTPIREFVFGHTQTQIEYFQTSNQSGNEKWEYWQHILQLRSLHTSVKEQRITLAELIYEIDDALSWWPIWSRSKRRRALPRLELKRESIKQVIKEKINEINCHLGIIERKYSHLKELKEKDILAEESDYWAMRLGRQLGASRLSRLLGISESEVLAVLALPKDRQQKVFKGMGEFLNTSNLLEGKND